MQDYRKLEVWAKSHEWVIKVYEITESFPKKEIFGITNQIRRSSVSIAANIAEGCGKNSSNELANFLNISLGSVNEVEYYLLLCKDLKYIEHNIFEKLNNELGSVKAMLISFVRKVRSGISKPKT